MPHTIQCDRCKAQLPAGHQIMVGARIITGVDEDGDPKFSKAKGKLCENCFMEVMDPWMKPIPNNKPEVPDFIKDLAASLALGPGRPEVNIVPVDVVKPAPIPSRPEVTPAPAPAPEEAA